VGFFRPQKHGFMAKIPSLEAQVNPAEAYQASVNPLSRVEIHFWMKQKTSTRESENALIVGESRHAQTHSTYNSCLHAGFARL
jgi:hypothetical protein